MVFWGDLFATSLLFKRGFKTAWFFGGDIFATSLLFKRGFKTAWFFGEISLRLLFCLKEDLILHGFLGRSLCDFSSV
jgi:hypothetical protein